jgi:hypothetical protein
MKFKILSVGLILLISGCVTISSSPVSIIKFSSVESTPRELTILNDTAYLGEMTLAFAKYGFKVKPISSQEIITEQKTPTISSQRKQSSARYGMIIKIDITRQICAFTDYRIINATVSIIDIKSNENIAIFKQRGSDGPCTTVTPVFDSLAEEVVKLWD